MMYVELYRCMVCGKILKSRERLSEAEKEKRLERMLHSFGERSKRIKHKCSEVIDGIAVHVGFIMVNE